MAGKIDGERIVAGHGALFCAAGNGKVRQFRAATANANPLPGSLHSLLPMDWDDEPQNWSAGLRPAMSDRLAREKIEARRLKGRRDACPTTFFKNVLRDFTKLNCRRAARRASCGCIPKWRICYRTNTEQTAILVASRVPPGEETVSNSYVHLPTSSGSSATNVPLQLPLASGITCCSSAPE